MTTAESSDPPLAKFGWLARRRLGNATALTAETAARREALAVQREVDDYNDSRSRRGGRHARADNDGNGDEHRPTWTVGKVLSAIGLLICYGLVVVVMAVAAIAWQTGFLDTVLPDQFKKINVFFLPVPIELAKVAPVALEFTSWVLAITTVVLALRELDYGKPHRLMWGISLFVAASNGWHIADATGSMSLGIAYGAFSIIGPAMIHYYVLALVLLRSGMPVRQALAEARSDLFRAVVRIVATLLKVVLGVVIHPVITWRSISIMTAHTQLTYLQARWIASGAHRQRLRAEVLRFTNGEWSPARPGWRVALASFVGALRPRGGKVDADEAGTATVQGVLHTPGEGVQEGVHGDGDGVQIRPETPLTTADDGAVHGGVLTAVQEPGDSVPDTVHGAVQDAGTAAILRALDNPHGIDAEYADLVRALEEQGLHGVLPPADGTVHGAVEDGVHEGVQGVGQGAHDDTADRADGPHAGVQHTGENTVHGTDGGVQHGRNGVQHDQPHGVQHGRHTVRHGQHDQPHGVQHTGVHGVPDTLPAPRAQAAQGRAAHRAEDRAGVESTAVRNFDEGLIVQHYWELKRTNQDVEHTNRTDIARLLFGETNATAKRSKVSRVWAACLRGEHPDPNTGTPAARDDTAA